MPFEQLRRNMTYEITPEHFEFTKRRELLVAGGFLAGAYLCPVFIQWIINRLWHGSKWASPPLTPWTIGHLTGFIIFAIVFVCVWLSAYNYSLEIDDNSARVRWRVVRKGYVRYFREFKGGLFNGPRMELSEHGPRWVRFLGGTVVVPKGLPDYEQIKSQVSTWLVDAAPPAER